MIEAYLGREDETLGHRAETAMMYFEGKQHLGALRQGECLRDVSIQLEQAGRGADRRQRRRQDHDLARDHGLKKPSQGEIWFEGERIDQLPPAKIVARGIAMVPEAGTSTPTCRSRTIC